MWHIGLFIFNFTAGASCFLSNSFAKEGGNSPRWHSDDCRLKRTDTTCIWEERSYEVLSCLFSSPARVLDGPAPAALFWRAPDPAQVEVELVLYRLHVGLVRLRGRLARTRPRPPPLDVPARAPTRPPVMSSPRRPESALTWWRSRTSRSRFEIYMWCTIWITKCFSRFVWA